MKTILVYGPQGCGKSRAAETLAKHYGCDHVVDDWRPGHPLLRGALHLTAAAFDDLDAANPHVQVVAFADALLGMCATAHRVHDSTECAAAEQVQVSRSTLVNALVMRCTHDELVGAMVDHPKRVPSDALATVLLRIPYEREALPTFVDLRRLLVQVHEAAARAGGSIPFATVSEIAARGRPTGGHIAPTQGATPRPDRG